MSSEGGNDGNDNNDEDEKRRNRRREEEHDSSTQRPGKEIVEAQSPPSLQVTPLQRVSSAPNLMTSISTLAYKC